jgi:hypothetical protein
MVVNVRKEDLHAGDNALLEREAEILATLAGGGRRLHDMLEDIARLVEQQEPEALCSVLVIDGTPQQIVDVAGPNVPPAYRDAVVGLPVRPWERSAALDHSFAWRSSLPVTVAGQLFAALEISSRAPGKTVAIAPNLIQIATSLVALAISRDDDMRDSREAEVRFRGLVERMPLSSRS